MVVWVILKLRRINRHYLLQQRLSPSQKRQRSVFTRKVKPRRVGNLLGAVPRLRVFIACSGALVICGLSAVGVCGCGGSGSADVTPTSSSRTVSVSTAVVAPSAPPARTTVPSPVGASTPQAAALAFENALDNEDAATLCQYATPHYIAEVAELLGVGVKTDCRDIMTNDFSSMGAQAVDPSTEHPTVVSTHGSGDIVYVRIDFNIPPGAVAQLSDSTLPVDLIDGRWLVDAANT